MTNNSFIFTISICIFPQQIPAILGWDLFFYMKSFIILAKPSVSGKLFGPCFLVLTSRLGKLMRANLFLKTKQWKTNQTTNRQAWVF